LGQKFRMIANDLDHTDADRSKTSDTKAKRLRHIGSVFFVL